MESRRGLFVYCVALSLCLLCISAVLLYGYCGSSSLASNKEWDVAGRMYNMAMSSITASCSVPDSTRYLQELCNSYHEEKIAGSACEPLCDSRDIVYTHCFPNGKDKLFVARAMWGERQVVLKTSRRSFAMGESLGHHSSLSVEDFKTKTAQYIQGVVGFPGNSSVSDPILERVVRECDVHGDGVLTGLELGHCSRLIQPGFIMGTLLKDSVLVPLVYGTCGEMMVFEYASSEKLHTSILKQRPWKKNVELAIAVLDMVKALEHTPFGTLYLCDLQWKNLGVINKPGGGIAVKTIDNDKSYFETSLERKIKYNTDTVGIQCAVDHDCRVCGCTVKCNKTTHTCSQQLHSNNLELVCKVIFWNNFNRMLPALLTSPPTWVSSRLNSLIRQCLDSGHTHHIPHNIIDQFYVVLWQSRLSP